MPQASSTQERTILLALTVQRMVVIFHSVPHDGLCILTVHMGKGILYPFVGVSTDLEVQADRVEVASRNIYLIFTKVKNQPLSIGMCFST